MINPETDKKTGVNCPTDSKELLFKNGTCFWTGPLSSLAYCQKCNRERLIFYNEDKELWILGPQSLD